MASIIRIKRSSSAGDPQVLGAGELAYSSLSGTQANGGDRVYIGVGTETNGDAAVHHIIGGKYFTDLLDHQHGTLTPDSALIVDSDSKIDVLNVDNLTLNGNTLSSTNTSGDINITPNGSGKVVLTNPYIGSDSLEEYIYDTVGGAVTGGTGITITNDDAGDTSTVSITNTGVTADSYGSASEVPVLTVNAQGQITSATTATIFTSFNIDADVGTTDNVAGGETLTISGDTGITTTVSNNSISIDLDDTAVTPNSYGSATKTVGFTVDQQGRLTAASETNVSATLNLNADSGTSSVDVNGDSAGADTLTVAGGTGISTSVLGTTVTVTGDDATTTTKGVASFNSNDFSVSSGAVSIASGGVSNTQLVNSTITVSSDSGSNAIDLGDTLTVSGGTGISTSVSGDTITVTGDDATTTTKGVASFDSTDFIVTAGAVEVQTTTLGTSSLNPGEITLTLAGLEQLDVDNIRIDGNEISSTDANGTISINPDGTGHVSVNSSNIQDVADPVNDTDAANKRYVDAVAEGLHVHAPAHAYVADTLASITGGTVTYSNGTNGVGATLTLGTALDLAGGDLDGDTDITLGDRIIVAGESNDAHNGVYVVTSTTVLTRADDFDTPTEMAGGDFIFVTHGNTYADTGWVMTEAVSTVGSSPVYFMQFSGAGTYTAGAGLTLTGTEFDINLATNSGLVISSDELQVDSSIAGDGLSFANGVIAVNVKANELAINNDTLEIADTYVGQTSITTLGTITAGTWNATVVDPVYGGTGVNNGSSTITLAGNLVTSGANSLTLTTTSTTNVTLPTTGTLATLAGAETLTNKTLTNPDINGGTVDGASVGATTASTGRFTTVVATSTANATSEITGALVVAGGIGVDGDIHGNGTNEIHSFVIDGGTYN